MHMQPLRIEPVTAANCGPYLAYTYRSYRPCFRDERTLALSGLIAFRASLGETPAGMIVAHADKPNGRSRLLSVFVEGRFRKQGIGRALLDALVTHLMREKLPCIDAEYFALPNIAPFERLLGSGGWERPAPYSRFYRFDMAELARADWLRIDRLPSRYRIVPWSPELAERIAALPLSEEAEYRSYFDPNRQPELIDRDCSFILLDGEQPAGWSIVDRDGGDVLLYRAVYLREAYRKSWLGIALAVRTTHAGLATGVPVCVIQVRDGNGQMEGIIRRLVMPLQPKVTEVRTSFRPL
ncbi:GNAT family N-acetyltransferase [Paenibacillus sp. GYB003]|uniref:GNAT family N-acetyltransferase n=1 Tax=Paenibacillus sp. GYB003 TaxID=2994392 RepID=UPI002F96283E